MVINCIACLLLVASLPQKVVPFSAMTTNSPSTTTDNLSQNSTKPCSISSSEDNIHFTEEFLECFKFKLFPGEYSLVGNNSLYVPVYVNYSTNGGVWEYGNYHVCEENDSVAVAFICPPEQREYQPTDYFASYITVIGLSISLISLALHFVAFLVVPEMKNLPGKNLASLTVSLFFAYLIYLVGKLQYLNTPTCYSLGICFYYFLMVTFFWMNSISFDIFKSVKAATTKLRLISKSAELKWFVLYSIYSWITPAVLTGIVIAGDKTTLLPETLRPKFDEGKCWFRQRFSIIAFFAAPVALLMLVNVSFFIASAVIIFSNSMKTDDSTTNLKRTLKLYLKLAIIMGLVWITGLVAGIIDNVVLSYIFVVFTTLQGLFIFVAFTRFRKTGARLKESVNTVVTLVHSSSSSNFNLTNSKHISARSQEKQNAFSNTVFYSTEFSTN